MKRSSAGDMGKNLNVSDPWSEHPVLPSPARPAPAGYTSSSATNRAALGMYARLHEVCRATLGGDGHECTLDALSSLAATVLKLPDRDTARQVYEQRRTMPGARAATADAAENLAATEDDPGQIIELLTEAYRTRLDAQGPGHPRTARSPGILLVELLRHAGAAPPGSA